MSPPVPSFATEPVWRSRSKRRLDVAARGWTPLRVQSSTTRGQAPLRLPKWRVSVGNSGEAGSGQTGLPARDDPAAEGLLAADDTDALPRGLQCRRGARGRLVNRRHRVMEDIKVRRGQTR